MLFKDILRRWNYRRLKEKTTIDYWNLVIIYWEKVDGIKFRRKLCIRRYESDTPLTGDMPVFVEIKQRLDRVTQKRRAILPYRTAMQLCNDRQYPEEFTPDDKAVLDEIYVYLWQYNLRLSGMVGPGGRGRIGGGQNALVARFMKSPTFKALYEEKLNAVYQSAFVSDAMNETVEKYAKLIHSVNDECNLVEIEAYDQAAQKVLTFIEQRMEYLSTMEVLSK